MRFVSRSVAAERNKDVLMARCPFCNARILAEVFGSAIACGHFHGIGNGTHMVFRTPVKNRLQILGDMLDERLAKFEKKV